MGDKRYIRVPVRVNESELALLRAKAQRASLPLARYLREATLSDVVLVRKAG